MTKLTKREILNAILASASDFSTSIVRTAKDGSESLVDITAADIETFVKNEIALLDKKASTKTESKTAKQNAELTEIVYDFMEVGKPYTVNALVKELANDAITSPQKMTSLLRSLVTAGKVKNEKTKSNSLYTKVGA